MKQQRSKADFHGVLATQFLFYIITRVHAFSIQGLVSAGILPELSLFCNMARMGNCDFREGLTTPQKNNIDSYRSPRTRKVRDHFKDLYAATAEYASQLWVGRLAGKPGTRFTRC